MKIVVAIFNACVYIQRMVTSAHIAALANGQSINLPDTKTCIRRTITRNDLKNGTVAFDHAYHASADRMGRTGGFQSRSIEAAIKGINLHQGK